MADHQRLPALLHLVPALAWLAVQRRADAGHRLEAGAAGAAGAVAAGDLQRQAGRPAPSRAAARSAAPGARGGLAGCTLCRSVLPLAHQLEAAQPMRWRPAIGRARSNGLHLVELPANRGRSPAAARAACAWCLWRAWLAVQRRAGAGQ